ncbi:MAG TPA: ATP-binding protein, partial [Candidatus Thermoplasmatota archaeon]|nr:ATP-binding protein [Candidatus Thermoplasmatota archaeon]
LRNTYSIYLQWGIENMQDFEKLGVFYLGRLYDIRNKLQLDDLLLYDSKDLVTHAICIGMTGSGKTGLCVSLIEEAAIDGIPTIAIDPKGDITNLLLTFPELRQQDFAPWINEEDAIKKGMSSEAYAEQQAILWRNGLLKWGQDGKRIQRLHESADFVIYTPGSNAGVPISILKSFSAPPLGIRDDNELLQERITTTVTSLLGLLGINADPIRSREHILISTILAASWQRGEDLDIGQIIQRIQTPPMTRIGMLDVESFYPSKDRFELAMQLNNLLAAPGFSLWLEGEPLDINKLFYSANGKPKVSIFYTAHLNDAQRMFFTSLLLNQIVGWMRTQSGTTSLRSILYIDEVFGYLPPLANPPSKTPLLTLLKQARAFGLGIVLATQNPVDLDYKAISNAGTWFLGRLQTERDKARVMDGLEGASLSGQKQFDRKNMEQMLSALGNRIFLMNNVHDDSPAFFETRWALSYLRGPLTREQIKVLVEPLKNHQNEVTPLQPELASSVTPVVSSMSIKGIAQLPALPPDVPQYFLQKTPNQSENQQSVYHPYIIGVAQVRFTNAKTRIDQTKDVVFVTPVTDDPIPVNWDNSQQTNINISDLQKTPLDSVLYAGLPIAALKAKNYTMWQTDFANWLFKTQKLELLRSENLNTSSMIGETDRDFRIRLQQIAREKRDEEVNILRQKYTQKYAKIDERLRRAEMDVQEHEAQIRDQKYQTAISLGTTLLGGFLGRRTLGGVRTTTRDMGRSIKKKRESEYAKENRQSLLEEKQRLESQFQMEVNNFDDKINPTMENLETILITPSKTNIVVRFVALAWTPQ